jgi:hypothetical protein
MAAWRRNALSLFPELHDDIEREAFSPYALFFLLLPFARDAHKRGDEDALRRAYAVWPLWQARMDEPKLGELRRLLDGHAAPRWQDLRGVVPN